MAGGSPPGRNDSTGFGERSRLGCTGRRPRRPASGAGHTNPRRLRAIGLQHRDLCVPSRGVRRFGEGGVRTRRRENALFIHLNSGQVKSLTPYAVSVEFNPRTTPNKGASSRLSNRSKRISSWFELPVHARLKISFKGLTGIR